MLYASWAFESPRLVWTYVFFLSGWVVGLIFGDRSERKAVLACLLLFVVFLVEASVYLFAPIHWSATLPSYYEVLMGPIYAFGAIVRYSCSYCGYLAQVVCGTAFKSDWGTITLLGGECEAYCAIEGLHRSCPDIKRNSICPCSRSMVRDRRDIRARPIPRT